MAFTKEYFFLYKKKFTIISWFCNNWPQKWIRHCHLHIDMKMRQCLVSQDLLYKPTQLYSWLHPRLSTCCEVASQLYKNMKWNFQTSNNRFSGSLEWNIAFICIYYWPICIVVPCLTLRLHDNWKSFCKKSHIHKVMIHYICSSIRQNHTIFS